MKRSFYSFFLISIVLTVTTVAPLVSLAQISVDYENILSDQQLTAYQTMGKPEIANFLNSKTGYIRNFYTTSPDQTSQLTAADIIYQAAQTYRINPQFLLVLLQKEQGLIEDPQPQQSQLDWATGYGCFDNQVCNDHWRGFAKQVTSAAEQFRYYFDHINEYNYQPGKVAMIDGQMVVPENIATAALYNYTPHLQGNRLVKALWTKYFSFSIPDGSVVKVAGDPMVWLIQNSQKRAFTSYLALISRFSPSRILTIQQTDLDQFDRGFDIDFAAYSIQRGTPSGTIYLLTKDSKRRITSPEVFKALGFNPEEVDSADDSQLAQIPDAAPIDIGDAYPTGALLQDSKTLAIFYVEAGRKYPIPSDQIRKIAYPTLPIAKVAPDLLGKYPSGLPILFPDGTLLKGKSASVYVVSNQAKRLINSEKEFNTIGYKWASIIVTSDDILDLYPTGDPIVIN